MRAAAYSRCNSAASAASLSPNWTKQTPRSVAPIIISPTGVSIAAYVMATPAPDARYCAGVIPSRPAALVDAAGGTVAGFVNGRVHRPRPAQAYLETLDPLFGKVALGRDAD